MLLLLLLRGLALAGFNRGLDQPPPPGRGEGDRDSDMGGRSVAAGVPGMAGSGARVKVPADRLDVLPSFSRAGDACCRRSDGTLVEERRRRCEPVEGSEEVEGSSVVKEREEKRTQKRSEKSRQTRRNDRLGRDEPLRRNAQLLRFRVALLTRNSGRLCAGIERDVARPGRGQGPDGRGERRRKTLAGRTGGRSHGVRASTRPGGGRAAGQWTRERAGRDGPREGDMEMELERTVGEEREVGEGEGAMAGRGLVRCAANVAICDGGRDTARLQTPPRRCCIGHLSLSC